LVAEDFSGATKEAAERKKDHNILWKLFFSLIVTPPLA
jgi:hypothetical protein